MKCKNCGKILRETSEQASKRKVEIAISYMMGYRVGYEKAKEEMDMTQFVKVLIDMTDSRSEIYVGKQVKEFQADQKQREDSIKNMRDAYESKIKTLNDRIEVFKGMVEEERRTN
jgi:uncharacterized protein YukE